jgi:hypothetical protein
MIRVCMTRGATKVVYTNAKVTQFNGDNFEHVTHDLLYKLLVVDGKYSGALMDGIYACHRFARRINRTTYRHYCYVA